MNFDNLVKYLLEAKTSITYDVEIWMEHEASIYDLLHYGFDLIKKQGGVINSNKPSDYMEDEDGTSVYVRIDGLPPRSPTLRDAKMGLTVEII